MNLYSDKVCVVCGDPIEPGEKTISVHAGGEKQGEACSACRTDFL